MKSHGYVHLPASAEPAMTVTVEYLQEHAEELLDRVERENIAIMIQSPKGNVVMVPYWWHGLAFGTDMKQAPPAEIHREAKRSRT